MEPIKHTTTDASFAYMLWLVRIAGNVTMKEVTQRAREVDSEENMSILRWHMRQTAK